MMEPNSRVEPSITDTIGQDFKIRLGVEEEQFNIWREINKLNISEKCTVLLFVDAINENPDAKSLLRQLDELAASPWPWLKIIFTSRPETWYVIRRGVKLSESLYYQEKETIGIELGPFSYSEELKQFSRKELPEVFEKHRKEFNLQTSYEELNLEIKEALQDPLNLWLVANIYKNGSIPDALHSPKLIADYINALLKSARLNRADLNFLDKMLVPLLGNNNNYKNAIDLEDIDSAGSVLFEAVYNEQVLRDGRRMNQSFTNLVDADILVRQEEGRNQKIAFKYERFYEYFFGMRLHELAQASTNKILYYQKLIESTVNHPFLWGAIKSAFVNEIKNNGGKSITEICFTDDQKTKELMVASLTEAGNEVDVGKILENMLGTRKTINDVLSDRNKNDQMFMNAQKIVVEVASALEMITLLARLGGTASSKLRAHVVKYSYYLWSKNQTKGWQLLDLIVKQVRKGYWINIAPLDFALNFNLLIFLQHFGEADKMPFLQQSFRQAIGKALYFDNSVRFSEDIKRWLRNVVIYVTVGFVDEIAASSPRYFPANIPEVKLFYKLPKETRNNVLRIINYYEDPDFGNIDELVDLIQKIIRTNDAYATYILTHVIVVQFNKYKDQLMPLLQKLAYDALEKDPTCAIPFQVIHSPLLGLFV